MANPYFRFKQFEVYHDRCAMKVGTDGVLLGAWAALDGVATALDAGTGCGLLALMLAQRCPDLQIDAVELDPEACQQARENVEASPWASRIRLFEGALQDHGVDRGYDLLIANPPFFAGSTKNPEPSRRLARHTDSLGPEELLDAGERWLSDAGSLALIYPAVEAEAFSELAEARGWHCRRRLLVRGRPQRPIKRHLMQWQRGSSRGATEAQELVIEAGGRHQYSEAYAALTRDFYLRF